MSSPSQAVKKGPVKSLLKRTQVQYYSRIGSVSEPALALAPTPAPV